MNFPPLVLGTMYYGTRIDSTTAMKMIDQYLDRGFDLLDTGNNYAFWITESQGGESESLIGSWLARGGKGRARIATKIGARPRTSGGDLQDAEGLSSSAIRSAVEESLRRLGVDSVDLLYAHVDDQEVTLEESLGTLDEMVREGKAGAIGLSNLRNDRLEEALETMQNNTFAPVQVLQQRYSVLPPLPNADLSPHVLADDAVRATLSAHDIPLMAYSPLLEGSLSDESRALPATYNNSANRARRASLATQARSEEKSLPQMVLRRLVKQNVIPLVGARTPEQLANALSALD